MCWLLFPAYEMLFTFFVDHKQWLNDMLSISEFGDKENSRYAEDIQRCVLIATMKCYNESFIILYYPLLVWYTSSLITITLHVIVSPRSGVSISVSDVGDST